MRQYEITEAINKYGTALELTAKGGGEAVHFRGFLQPLRYKNKMYLGEVTTALGYDNSRKFLLITPPNIDVSVADGYSFAVTLDGKEYSCDHREIEYVGDEKVYAWAIVTLTA